MKSSRNLQILYALCAVAGVMFTMYFNVLFIIAHDGFSVTQFIAETYVNNASTSITNDLLVVVVAFLVWSFIESRRLKMRNWWAYFILTFSVAIAFALPLFLFNRERRLAEIEAENV